LFDECSDTTARRSPDHPLKEGEKDRHRLSGPLSGRGCAPTYDQPRQPILPAIIVAAQPAIVVVAAQASPLPGENCDATVTIRGTGGEEHDIVLARRFDERDGQIEVVGAAGN
jgi:hypothetical protein